MEEKTLEKITLKDWRKYALGEGVRGYKTDEFYCQLANDLYEILRPTSGRKIIPSEHMHLLCIRLSQYVEDVVSHLGIFQAFRVMNVKWNRRPLPFFDLKIISDEPEDSGSTEDGTSATYSFTKLNLPDILILIWDYAMTFNTAKSIPSPFNPDFDRLAKELKVIMDDAFRNAPKNEDLFQWLYPSEVFTDYSQVKERLLWFSQGCYLTASYRYYEELSEVMNTGESTGKESTGTSVTEVTVTEVTETEATLEGEGFGWISGSTPEQNKEYFAELLMFQKTTRLLSIPNKELYGLMFIVQGQESSAGLVLAIEGTAHDFKVKEYKDGKLLLQSVCGEEFLSEIPGDLGHTLPNPEKVGFINGLLVKYDSKWYLGCVNKFALGKESESSSEEENWRRRTEEYEHMKEDLENSYEPILRVLQNKAMGFYRNRLVCMAQAIEATSKEIVDGNYKIIARIEEIIKKNQTLLEMRDEINALYQKRHIVPSDDTDTLERLEDLKQNSEHTEIEDEEELQEELKRAKRSLKDSLNDLSDAKKKVIEINSKTSVKPIVVMVHEDKIVTSYQQYVTELDITSNPYASPSKKPKESLEYVILHHFDYDLAKAVLTDPSLVVSKQNLSPNMKRVRRFVAESSEFICRYCYHDCFSGMYGEEYNYPKGCLFDI